MLLIGQDNENIFRHTQVMGPVYAGYSMYFEFKKLPKGLTANDEQGAGTNNADSLVKTYGNGIVMNLAGQMVGQEDDIASGRLDDNVRSVCKWIKESQIPVFFRPGYEFDGPWNHYDPDKFKAAWRHVVDLCRKESVDNVFYVFHSSMGEQHFDDEPWDAWWPGDDYVDVMGISVFSQVYMKDHPAKSAPLAGDFNYLRAYDEFSLYAKKKGKPLMICESAPKNFRLPEDGVDAWNTWFLNYFDLIDRLDVRVVHYISDWWDAQEMWKGGVWGDSRVYAHRQVKDLWEQELQKPRWKNWMLSRVPSAYDPDMLDPERVAAFPGARDVNLAGTTSGNVTRFIVG
jgi:hypothetical protein